MTQFNSLHLCIPIHVSNEIDKFAEGTFLTHLCKICNFLTCLKVANPCVPSHVEVSWFTTTFKKFQQLVIN